MSDDYCPRCGATLKDGKCMNAKCPLIGTQIKGKQAEMTIKERWRKIEELAKNASETKTRMALLTLVEEQSDALLADSEKLRAMKKNIPQSNREETLKTIDASIESNRDGQDRLLSILDACAHVEIAQTVQSLKQAFGGKT